MAEVGSDTQRQRAADETDPRREIAVGTTELPPGMVRRAYFQKLRFLEARLPGDQIPSDRILRRWRNDSGGEGRFSLLAPRELCELARLPDSLADMRVLAGRLVAAARMVGAVALVFLTPSDVTPSSPHRDRLRQLFEEIAGAELCGDLLRVWQAAGLWRPGVADRLARDLGVIAAQDPLASRLVDEDPLPRPEKLAYARVAGFGRPARPLGQDDLARLSDWLDPCRRAFVAFNTPAKLRDATGLARWVGSSARATWN
jgi:uncharacterized protein YecE (DUF72 family)